jgi:hypothetical protein
MHQEQLRPLERAVRRLADEGMSSSEIAWRFRRSPGHIDRVLRFSRLPRTGTPPLAAGSSHLRPIERIVVRARDSGSPLPEIAARMRRSPNFVARVEQLATIRLDAGTSGTAQRPS